MGSESVVVVFINGLGNFLFFSASIKVLKKWGYDVTLITEERFLRSPALRELSEDIFSDIIFKFEPENHSKIFLGSWSIPPFVKEHLYYKSTKRSPINWANIGIHEVQHYLDVIGASWEDYDGYIFDTIETSFQADPNKTTIALSSCARVPNNENFIVGDKRKKKWNYLPELSQQLIDLGYEVILVGLKDELENCEGINFVDKLSIKETGDVISKCDLLIAPSTGNTIIADAVGTRVLLIEGPMQTARAHPLNVDYSVVRNHVSCAPCFQKSTWRLCQRPVCMENIKVGDVLIKMHQMLKTSNKKAFTHIHKPIEIPVEEPMDCDKKIIYLIPCFNRYHILKKFLKSFEESNLPDGKVYFLNDASQDPRVQELIDNFFIINIEKKTLIRNEIEKAETFHAYEVNPSVHAFNTLIKALFDDMEEGMSFDYVLFIDPDIIMRPNWIQKMILQYEKLISDINIGSITPFNTNHFKYDEDTPFEIQKNDLGSFRIRKGANLPYMLSNSFFRKHHSFFDVLGQKSMDLGKGEELEDKGFETLVMVPSLVEHFGAYSNSFLKNKNVITSIDFYEGIEINE